MALIPRMTRMPWEPQDRQEEEPTSPCEEDDTEDVHYYSSAPNGNNQLWVRRPGLYACGNTYFHLLNSLYSYQACTVSGYMDMILPPPGFTIWDMPSNKLQTTAMAMTFVATAALVSLLAGAGMLAILVTGAVVSASVLLLVTVCTAVVALVVTGVPVGYGAYQLLSRYQQMRGFH